VIKIEDCFNRVFNGLSSQHKQNNFFKEHGNFVEPKSLKIEEKKLGFYVPFKDKLQNILSIPETKILNNNNKLYARNIYSEISDGEYIKKLVNEKKEMNKQCGSKNESDILLLAMYYDDIEVVNAIGNSRKKHKLGN
jgi:hypothetical protein